MKTRLLLSIGIAFLISSCAIDSPKPLDPVPESSRLRVRGSFCETFDHQGVARFRASDGPAYWSCFGAIHARDRAFQMDFYRRIAQGRTAELFGKDSIAQDFRMRLMGLYEQADQLTRSLDAQTLENLWAYAIGVNSILEAPDQIAKFQEFQKWDYTPEPWHPRDSVAILLLQSFDQTRKSFTTEIEESEWIQRHGKEKIPIFDDDRAPWFTSIYKKGEYQTRTDHGQSSPSPKVERDSLIARGSFPETRQIDLFFEGIPRISDGSNNWAFDKTKSEQKNAVLANDPHLELQRPAAWHYVNAESGTLNVLGASFPGLPVVASGTNQLVSWGLTNSYFDHAQLASVSEDELLHTKTHRPLIWFRFSGISLPFIFKTYRKTPKGLPILPIPTTKGRAVVLNWSGFHIESQQLRYLFAFSQAKSVESAVEIMAASGIPSWNLVFADAKGDIAHLVTGRGLQYLKNTPPRGIPEMRLSEIEGLPWIPSEQMPALIKPKRGWIVTANNKTYPEDAALPAGYAARNSLRAHRIEELLGSKNKLSIEQHKSAQCDVTNVEARFLLPSLIARAELPSEVLQKLKAWDFQASLDCQVCALYRRWTDRLMTRLNLNLPALHHELTHGPESLSQQVNEELQSTLKELKSSFGTELPKWGDVHQIRFPHLTKDNTFAAEGTLASPGDEHTVSPGSADYDAPIYSQKSGASHRLIVEMSTPPKVWMGLAGRNEGWERPDFKASRWVDWRDCRLSEIDFPISWDGINSTKIKF